MTLYTNMPVEDFKGGHQENDEQNPFESQELILFEGVEELFGHNFLSLEKFMSRTGSRVAPLSNF